MAHYFHASVLTLYHSHIFLGEFEQRLDIMLMLKEKYEQSVVSRAIDYPLPMSRSGILVRGILIAQNMSYVEFVDPFIHDFTIWLYQVISKGFDIDPLV